jgi:hypothetical protein
MSTNTEKIIIVDVIVIDLQIVAMRPNTQDMIPNDDVGKFLFFNAGVSSYTNRYVP